MTASSPQALSVISVCWKTHFSSSHQKGNCEGCTGGGKTHYRIPISLGNVNTDGEKTATVARAIHFDPVSPPPVSAFASMPFLQFAVPRPNSHGKSGSLGQSGEIITNGNSSALSRRKEAATESRHQAY